MTSLVLDAQTSKTTIGDVLAAATGPEIEIKDESGRLIARIVMNAEVKADSSQKLVERAEAELDELRRRRTADRAADVTTQQLLARAENMSRG
jgi:hypothetical protein